MMLSLRSDANRTTYQFWAKTMPTELSQWEDQKLVYLGIAVVLGSTFIGMLIGLAVLGWGGLT